MSDKINQGGAGSNGYGAVPHLMVGVVKDNEDPLQTGRLRIYIPSYDNAYYKTEDLTWATYITPFGGTVDNMQVGRGDYTVPNLSSYGFWSVPKIGAHVLCGFLNGDPQMRFWMGCMFLPETNMTLPSALNDAMTELDPSDKGYWPSQPIAHMKANAAEAGLDGDKTRGNWERSVAYPSRKTKDKGSDDGYAPKPGGGDKDSQVFSWTTPGRHFITMSDVNDHCRVRLKTTEGHQIIFDDTNERVYINTAKGRNWIEIDEDGRIHIYAKDQINIRAEQDINMMSEKNINIKARKKVNIKSMEEDVNVEAKKWVHVRAKEEDIRLMSKTKTDIKVEKGPVNVQAEKDINLMSDKDKINLTSKLDTNIKSEAKVKIQAKGDMHLKSKSKKLSAETDMDLGATKIMTIEGKQKLNLNTQAAKQAEASDPAKNAKDIPDLEPKLWEGKPMVEPQHEPWDRPPTRLSRNGKWKAK